MLIAPGERNRSGLSSVRLCHHTIPLFEYCQSCRQCGARTKSGKPCRSPATKKGRCRLHGGARGSGAPPGKRNGQYRHGERTKAAITEQQRFSASGRPSKRSRHQGAISKPTVIFTFNTSSPVAIGTGAAIEADPACARIGTGRATPVSSMIHLTCPSRRPEACV
jgi:hypothetical protein